jgi:hypothetical protein
VAWWNAVPKPDDSKVEVTKTRLEIIKEDGRAPHYPPLECAQHIVNYLFEIGPVMSGGMGTVQISNTELQDWQRNIGITLNPWEARFIRKLSADYQSESHRAAKEGCPAPWQSGIEHFDKKQSVADMKNAIRALAAL